MIISASRRTDIPAFFSDWFLKRLDEGYVEIPNPFNPKQISFVSLRREDVDAFVFWTRFPTPFFRVLEKIHNMGYPFYFLITITAYDKTLELNRPELQKQIDAFKKLVDLYGNGIAVWRYDPIIISEITPYEFHLKFFEQIALQLKGYTDEVKISFYDPYKKAERNIRMFNQTRYQIITNPDQLDGFGNFLMELYRISNQNEMTITSCAENLLSGHSEIKEGKCIDPERLKKLYGISLSYKKDPSQRKECHCSISKDIGIYNTCKFGCLYCYATTNHRQLKQ